MSEKCQNSMMTIAVSFLTGAALGAGLSLLYAPKSGCETRKDITDLSTAALEKIKSYGREAQEKIKDLVEESKETIAESKSALLSAIEAGKTAMHKVHERQET